MVEGIAAQRRGPPAVSNLTGVFFLPTFFSLAQFWGSFRSIQRRATASIDDGIHYVTQARLFQDSQLPWQKQVEYVLEYGLYPRFLSLFDFSNLTDWSTASTHPKVFAVYAAQALLLSACTAVFLFMSFRLISGGLFKRTTLTTLMGILLLRPSIVFWPSAVLTETLTLSGLLLFVIGGLAYDAEKRGAILLVGVSSCLLVLIRDPMIFFVWLFVGLLGLNILFACSQSRRALALGVAVLLLAIGLGGIRASVLASSDKYPQVFVNIIQFRILPDSERRAFFADRGLALSPTVMERSGKPAWFNNTLFLADREVSTEFLAYRNWVVTNGIRTYAAFLLTHPSYVLKSLVESPNSSPNGCGADFRFSLKDLFISIKDLFPVSWYGFGLQDTRAPQRLGSLALVPLGWLATILYLGVVAVRYVRSTVTRSRASSIEAAALAAAAGIFISYHTDACDLWRHTFPFVMLIYFSMIVRVPEIARDVARFALRRGRAVRPTDTIVPAGDAEPSRTASSTSPAVRHA